VSGSLLLSVIVAQTVQAQSTADADLERIRKALTKAPAISLASPPSQEGPVFRITVFGRKPEKPLWVDWSAVPTYIRPFAPSYHYEFLKQVTPEEFRAGTLHPSGIPVDQVVGFLARQLKAANRKRQEANAKEEVRKALEELHACRANPGRAGC
jgi:hypothetical protein